jgi:WD40 repeat protein
VEQPAGLDNPARAFFLSHARFCRLSASGTLVARMGGMARTLRIFVSSPGDVMPERRRAQLVIEKLAKTYARFFAIEPILWELEPMLASGHFQDQITPPGETDIVILIVWSRLGTPLPEKTATRAYRGLDGRVPVSGTEWEFEDAVGAQQKRGAPDLLAYRKEADPIVSLKDAAAMTAAKDQWDKLEAFWRRWFVDRGQFRAAFGEFTDLDGFEAKLESDLGKLIEKRAQDLRDSDQGMPAPVWLAGSPFRGLDSYRFEHAPIFFGRSAMTKAAVEQLTTNAENGRAFLLILGASGAGKSSLAQAGALPALVGRGIVPGVGLWRCAVMRPGGHAGGPFAGLAEALVSATALPELLAGRQDHAALARHLRASVDDPAFSIVTALDHIEAAARARGDLLAIETARFALVLDQLEELFTAAEITGEERIAFVRCLDGLATSGRVYVLATMRSDYWHRAAETPKLVEMAAGSGRLDLLPATQDEIIEMIRQPAEATGIAFERDPTRGIGLDATLAAEAADEPGALPLLSFLLDELYKRDIRDGDSTLTYASMRALGGLKGAIANRAEAAFATLPDDVQAALPHVLHALVTVSRLGAGPVARPAILAQFADGGPERKLVDALLAPQVRLLVADGDGTGARVRLAHEALFTHWDRARRQLAQDRRDLETRDIVEQQQVRWASAAPGQARNLLLRDPDLANAIALDCRWSNELDAKTRAFIAASHQRARRRQRLAMAAAAAFALLFVAASVLGGLAYRSKGIAEDQRYRAAVAEASRHAALAQQLALVGRIQAATAVALDAAPLGDADPRPVTPELEAALHRTLGLMQIPVERFLGENVFTLALSPDEQTLAAGTVKGDVYVLDAATLRQRAHFKGGNDVASSLEFSSDGQRLLVAGDVVPGVWDAASGRKLFDLNRPNAKKFAKLAHYSPDGRLIVVGTSENRAAVHDATDGKLLHILPGAAFEDMADRLVKNSGDDNLGVVDPIAKAVASATWQIWGAATEAVFSPDGKIIAVTGPANPDSSVLLFDTETGALVRTLTGGFGTLFTGGMGYGRTLAFSPNGSTVIAAPSGTMIKIWNVADGALRAQFPARGIGSFVLTSDGQAVISAHDNGSLIVRCIGANASVVSIQAHDGRIIESALSTNRAQTLLATGSVDQSARVWQMPTGPDICNIDLGNSSADILALRRPVAIFPGHDELLQQVLFSDSRQALITSSKDGWVRVWSINQDRVTIRKPGEQLPGQDKLIVSRDGRSLFASSSGHWSAWDAANGQPIALPDDVVAVARGDKAGAPMLFQSAFSWRNLGEAPPPRKKASPDHDPSSLDDLLSPDQPELPQGWSEVSNNGALVVVSEAYLAASANKDRTSPNQGSLNDLTEEAKASPNLLVDAKTKQVIARLTVGDRRTSGFFFSADDSRLFARTTVGNVASGEGDGMAVWDTRTGKLIAAIDKVAGWSTYSEHLKLAANGRRFMLVADRVQLFDVSADGIKPIAVPPTGVSQQGDRKLTAVSLSADGGSYLAGYSDGLAVVADIDGHRPRRILDTRGVRITQLAMSPDGRYLAAADQTNGVWIFDVTIGELVRSVTLAEWVTGLRFFPDGDRLLITSAENFMILGTAPPIGGQSDIRAIMSWARGMGLDLVSEEDRRRYKLGLASLAAQSPEAAAAPQAGRWAALVANDEATSPVAWGATKAEAENLAAAACKRVSGTCNATAASTNDQEATFVTMCCLNPRASCAVSVGPADTALHAVKRNFSATGSTGCTVRAALSAQDGLRH